MNRAAKRRGRPAQSEPNYIACLDWNFGFRRVKTRLGAGVRIRRHRQGAWTARK